jgi:hypothetical protein
MDCNGYYKKKQLCVLLMLPKETFLGLQVFSFFFAITVYFCVCCSWIEYLFPQSISDYLVTAACLSVCYNKQIGMAMVFTYSFGSMFCAARVERNDLMACLIWTN